MQLVKDTSCKTGLKEREISVLAAHLTVMPKGAMAIGALNTSFMEIGQILERANCMEPRRFHRGESTLEALGFAQRKLSANGRRYPLRDVEGAIIDAYGFCMTPLLHRVPELIALREAIQTEAAERRNLQSQISARISQMKRDALSVAGEITQDLQIRADEIRRIIRRKATPLPQLHSLLDQLDQSATDSMSDKQTAVTAPVPGPQATGAVISSVAAVQSPKDQPVETAGDASQTVRHIESRKKEYIKNSAADDVTQVHKLWPNCTQVQSFYPKPPSSSRDLINAIFEFSSFLGLGQALVASAASRLGWSGLLVVLDYCADKVASIKNMNGYFKSMLSSYENGNPVAGGRLNPQGVYTQGAKL